MPENEEMSEFLTSLNAIAVIFNRGRYLHKICISLHACKKVCTISGRTASYFTNILRKFEESLCLVKSDIFVHVNMRHSGIETVQSLVKACLLIFLRGGGCNGIWLFVWNNSPIGFCLRFNNRLSCMYISNSKFAKSAGNLLKFLINLCKIIILCFRPSGSS